MIKVFDLDNFANKNFILYKRAKFGDSTKMIVPKFGFLGAISAQTLGKR